MKKYCISILFFGINLSLINCQIEYDLRIPNSLNINYQNLYFNNNSFCSNPKIDSVLNSINSLKLELLDERPLNHGSINTIVRFINSSNIDKIGRISIIDTIANIISYQTIGNTIYPNSGIIKIKKDSISVNSSLIKTNLDELEKQLNFWNSQNYVETDADDCQTWTIEWSEKGRYHSLHLECPSDRFLESCKILLKMCKLD